LRPVGIPTLTTSALRPVWSRSAVSTVGIFLVQLRPRPSPGDRAMRAACQARVSPAGYKVHFLVRAHPKLAATSPSSRPRVFRPIWLRGSLLANADDEVAFTRSGTRHEGLNGTPSRRDKNSIERSTKRVKLPENLQQNGLLPLNRTEARISAAEPLCRHECHRRDPRSPIGRQMARRTDPRLSATLSSASNRTGYCSARAPSRRIVSSSS
jgi:hypothetical protein